MSAFMVSKKHIDYMVRAIIAEKLWDGSADELGRMLWRECLNSVACRYPDDADGDRPGPIDFRDSDVDEYTWEPCELLKQGALASTLACYDYQSCEHPGWDNSEANRIVSALYERVRQYEGDVAYNNTPWGWD